MAHSVASCSHHALRCTAPAAALLAAAAFAAAAVPTAAAAAPAFDVSALLTQENLEKYRYELVCVALVLLFAANYLGGSRANRNIAHTWLRYLGREDGILARNFAHVPTPDARHTTWQDSNTLYRAYASGRRCCTGAILSVRLRERQDLFYRLWYILFPQEDTLEVEVFMNEGAVPPSVCAVARGARALKALAREHPGLAEYTKPVNLSRDRATNWTFSHARYWAVLAEHPSFLYDLLNAEPAVAKALGLPWFRCALITSEDVGSTVADQLAREGGGSGGASGGSTEGGEAEGGSGGSGSGGRSGSGGALVHMRFVFALPPLGSAEELQQLVAAVFLLVDLVGTYKASPEMKKRGQELRARLQQEAAKRRSEGRQGELAQKRAERLEAERAKARAAGPQALAKFEERIQRQQRNKEMRKRIVRA